MTKKQNKLSFRPSLLTVVLCLLPLMAFFCYATVYYPSLLYILAGSMLLFLSFLFPLHSFYEKQRSLSHLQQQDLSEDINLVKAKIVNQKNHIESFKEKIADASQLKGLTEKLSQCLSLENTSNVLTEEASKIFGREDTTLILYLFHSKTGKLGISSSQKGLLRINLKAKQGDAFDEWVAKTMQPLLIENIKRDYRFDSEKIIRDDHRGVRSLMSVPLIVSNKALGILRIDCPQENRFATEDLRFLTTVGDLGAVAIENAQLYESIEQLAIRDSLTRLYLRRYLMERMPEELSRHLRRNESFAFFMIDIDHFKNYNDTHGHRAGDVVLKTVSQILENVFEDPGVLICRYGGEEFVVLHPTCSVGRAKEIAEKCRREVEISEVVLRRKKTSVTVSIGVAMFPDTAKTKEDLISLADQAMYQAKQSGRNQVCFARSGGVAL